MQTLMSVYAPIELAHPDFREDFRQTYENLLIPCGVSFR
jgi:hypothetical protein